MKPEEVKIVKAFTSPKYGTRTPDDDNGGKFTVNTAADAEELERLGVVERAKAEAKK